MSWITRVDNGMLITCGDGRTFSPLWKKATKVKEYNTAQFDFKEVSGSLVKRGKPRGRKFGIIFWFQGEDHIEQSNSFEASADDSRAWEISHPLYDRLLVQPLSMNIDNSSMNVTQYTVTVIETITEDNPQTTEDPVDKVVNDHTKTGEQLEEVYAITTIPNANDISEMTTNNLQLYEEGKKIAKTTTDYEKYFGLFNEANAAILNATAEPLTAMRKIQAVINAPALFVNTVKARMETLETQFNKLTTSISTVISPSSKKYYESEAGGIVGAMTLASVSNTDYSNRNDVLAVIDQINTAYDTYALNLENLQTDSNNSTESYIPSFDSQRQLNDLVNYTVARLFEITEDARQERLVILEHDDNIINLAHRFYGLEQDDSSIDELVNTNEIGISELLVLKKGRTIKYYI